VHMLIRGPSLAKGMSDYLHNRIRRNDKIKVHVNSEVTEVFGQGNQIESIEVIDCNTKATRRIDCTALFVFIGAEPHTQWLPAQVERDDHGYLKTGIDAILSGRWPTLSREPCPLETTLPGVLAAGDVRMGSTKRVGFAVGDGSLAVTCVHRLRALQA